MKNAIIAAVIALLVSAGAHYWWRGEPPAVTREQDTAFDRIMKTNTLRCGYAIATPWFMIDPNTKQKTGVGYDITNAIANKMDVKVDWVEETDWGLAEQGLLTNRYDMLCGSVCIDPRRARAATFSTPFLHIPILVAVRQNDKRFDGGLQTINNANISIGVKNGHVFEFVSNEQFPLAKKIYANSLSDDTEFLQMLKYGKVDIALSGQATIDDFNKKNPDTPIRSLGEPARFCNGAFMVPLGDERLKNVVDNAIGELNSSGQIGKILEKYVPSDPRYARTPAKLYSEGIQ